MTEKKVTIYSTPTCPFCKRAKAYLTNRGISYTDNNVAEDKAKAKLAKTKAKVDLMKAYAPFKIAQRYLAVLFGVTYISTYIFVIVLTSQSKEPDKYIEVMKAFSIDWAMLTILAFYFGAGLSESIMRKKND